ncbi:isomerase YbhE [Penicillium malachiteum]|uniref:isomerase YbhE n=1 Tax=Penicillium malachiteum TaxID=1324776 RepID=UPI0025466C20|nr:isomerase YbhE [Penicillium malachiteum]KAJ5726069.1 isomerase YbhE [Penicillium malachiteum]
MVPNVSPWTLFGVLALSLLGSAAPSRPPRTPENVMHRGYVWLYENALRDECGYKGVQSYWDWPAYVKDGLEDSTIFDGGPYSLGSNGRGNDLCVYKGPFSNYTATFRYFSNDIIMDNIENNGNGSIPSWSFDYSPNCFQRALDDDSLRLNNNYSDIEQLLSQPTISDFQNILSTPEGDAHYGPHGGGHVAMGGDGADLFTSPTDPVFFLIRIECLLDGAYAGFYANGKALAVAHYTSSALQTYDITDPNGKIKPLQTFTYTMSKEGPAGARQAAPHIHETRTDPLEQYVLAVDLGADKVRIYAIDDDTLLLDERKALNATPGSGPRHGVFTQEPIRFADGKSDYVFYLGAEIAGTITAYRVKYLPNRGGIDFVPLPNGTYSSLEPGVPKPYTTGKGITGELRLSPDGNFLIVSNRRDERFNGTVTQYPPSGKSDSMSTFRIRYDLQGKLDFVQAASAGGYVAQTYDLNTAGDLAAVGVQLGQRISILERDLGSGLFKEQVAYLDLDGEMWGVLWNDKVNN